ncbi:MAG TPA: DUF4340 domain-containing protein [Polyangiaceae bacterium]
MKLGRSEIASLSLGVLALASAGLVFATREAPTTEERSERENHLLPLFRKPEITSVSLERGGQRAELERNGEDWTLKRPVSEPADGAAVDRLIDGLGFATRSRSVTGTDRNELGFARPRATLALVMGRERYTVLLGAEAPAPAGGAYVEVIDGAGARAASVVKHEIAELLLVNPDDLRRRGLVGTGQRELAELHLETAGGAVHLIRGKGVAFRLDGKELADRDRTQPLFAAVAGLSATRFLDLASAEKAQADAALLRVKLVPRDTGKQPELLEIGGPCPAETGATLAVVRAPVPRAACVSNDSTALLRVDRATLIATAPFAARKDEVESLKLERSGKSLVMTRRGSGFALQRPSEAEVELEVGNQRLDAILQAPSTIVADVNPKELGLEPPNGRVVLTVVGDDDKASEETLEIGAVKPDGTLYVRRSEDGVVLALAREAARAYTVDSTLLRSRKVLDFALSSLAHLELSTPEHQRLERSANGFTLVHPAGFQHDGDLATQAVLALGSLTALRFAADEDDGSFGFAKPALTASFAVDTGDAGANEKRLVVGSVTSGGFFAELAGSPGVFVVERSVVERLRVLLIDRGAFLTPPETVERLVLATPERSIELKREAGVLAAKGGDVDPAALAGALEALGALRAEAALHTGSERPEEALARPVLTVSIEPGAGFGPKRSFRIGSADEFRGQPVRFARVDKVDATFAIAQARLRPLFDLF